MQSKPTIAFHTLGCKLNYSETSALSRLAEEQFSVVPISNAADVYVINTCSVTEQADKKCRQFVRRVLRQNQKAFVAVVGCYAQLKPKEISEIPGVDVVLGAAEKFNLIEHLTDLTKKEQGEYHSCAIEDVNGFNHSFSYGDRTRTFLKIQDGCDYSCAFCTIPLARGKSRSDTIASVMEKANKISKESTKEVVLTGVNIGDFGKGQTGGKRVEETFLDLIKQLDTIKGVERFRISSIEPNLLNNEIIEFVAQSKRFVPHFHIPLQSGSNEILAAMKRRYKRELYVDRVAHIKTTMPHCCIGVDVITGFPGETEEHFMDTYQFLENLDISYLHVFTYSERDNTLATTLPNTVPQHIRNARTRKLRALSEIKRQQFYRQHLGENRPVLFEKVNKDGMLTGFTDNYIKVNAAPGEYQENTIETVTLDKYKDGLVSITKVEPVTV